jgi:hypothetical protein
MVDAAAFAEANVTPFAKDAAAAAHVTKVAVAIFKEDTIDLAATHD